MIIETLIFIFKYLPDILIHIILLIGILGYIASFIPLIPNKIILKNLSILFFVLGVYFEGGLAITKEYENQQKEWQTKIQIAEQKSKEETVRIETQVVERIKYVRGKTEVVVAKVPIYITKEVDAKYPVPNSFVLLHDAAARSEVPPSSGSAYEGTSDIKISEVTRTVAENYGTCHEVRQQLLGWQDWYRTQKKIYESVK